MVSRALQSAAEELGFTYVSKDNPSKGYLYGVYGGYLVTLTDSGNNKTAFVNYYLPVPEEQEDAVLLLELSESLKNAGADAETELEDYDVQCDGLSCTVSCDTDAFFSLLDGIIDALEEKGVLGVTHCSCCGSKFGKRFPKKMHRGKNNYLLCEHCTLEKIEENNHAVPMTEQLPKKTLAGIGAGIGAGMIGIFLYILTYRFLAPMFDDSAFEVRYIFCLFGFITALLVYRGFTLVSKRPCISAYVSISAITVICSMIGQYFGTFIAYAEKQNFTFVQATKIPSMWLIHLRSTMSKEIDYPDATKLLYDVAPLFYKLLAFSILFAVIGTVIFQLGLYEKGKAKPEVLEVESLKIAQ